MKLKIPYPSLDETLLFLKDQVIDSLQFADEFLPEYKMSPKELFDFLKEETIYMNDPHRIELLQSMQTLFGEDNQHSIYGAGDCDCFTIAALASLHTNGYKNIGIALAGRNPRLPSHIYATVNGKAFDLTNSEFGKERPYPFIQYLPVKIY